MRSADSDCLSSKFVLCNSTCLYLSVRLFSVIKYRPQKIVLPACPGDLPACPPKRTKVKGKCAGVPSIYILQPAIGQIKNTTDVCWGMYSCGMCLSNLSFLARTFTRGEFIKEHIAGR